MPLNRLSAKVPAGIGAVDLRVKAYDADCNSATYAITITATDQDGAIHEVVTTTLADVVGAARLNQVRACMRAAWQEAADSLLPRDPTST